MHLTHPVQLLGMRFAVVPLGFVLWIGDRAREPVKVESVRSMDSEVPGHRLKLQGPSIGVEVGVLLGGGPDVLLHLAVVELAAATLVELEEIS